MIRLLYDNTKFDVNAVLTASSEVSTLPSANLQDTIRKKVWRTTAGAVNLDIDFGESVIVDALGLVEHTMNYSATVTVISYVAGVERNPSAAGAVNKGSGKVGIPSTAHGLSSGDLIFISATENYNGLHVVHADTATDEIVIEAAYVAETFASTDTITKVTQQSSEEVSVWDSILGWGQGGWGEGGWGGIPTDEYLEAMPKTAKVVALSIKASRFWRIAFDNGTDAFDLGRLYLCRRFETAYGIEYGWKIQLVDPSKTEYSRAGVPLTDEKDKYYLADFTLGDLLEGEVFGPLLQAVNIIGVSRDAILQMAPENPGLQGFTTIYGRFVKSPSPSNSSYATFKSRIQFRESN